MWDLLSSRESDWGLWPAGFVGVSSCRWKSKKTRNSVKPMAMCFLKLHQGSSSVLKEIMKESFIIVSELHGTTSGSQKEATIVRFHQFSALKKTEYIFFFLLIVILFIHLEGLGISRALKITVKGCDVCLLSNLMELDETIHLWCSKYKKNKTNKQKQKNMWETQKQCLLPEIRTLYSW